MRDLKCRIIPVIIGATRIVTKGLWKNLEAIPGKQSVDLLQKTAVLGTSCIIWKVLQSEICSLRSGDHHWFKRSTKKKRPVEMMTMTAMVMMMMMMMMMTTTTTIIIIII